MKFDIVYELVYYDRPLCYLLDSGDKFYIGHFIKYVGDDLERWFVHYISKEDLSLLCKGKKDLRSVTNVEEKYLYDFKIDAESIESNTFVEGQGKWTIDPNELEEYLPSGGFLFFEGELEEVEDIIGETK